MKIFLQTPFQLGKITLPNNIFYAPLAGCSDFPFRQMSARYRPGLIYCEMVKMDALIQHLGEKKIRINGHRWVFHRDVSAADTQHIIQACRDYSGSSDISMALE